jgi:DNA repair exonuclease SbcCD ATPase subunit
LSDLNWRAIAGEAEPAELKGLQKKLEKVASEQDRVARTFKRNKALLDDPDTTVSQALLSSIAEAEKRIVGLTEERERITAEMEELRSRSTTIEQPEQLLKAICSRDGSNETRARLRQEIQKRVQRINIDFSSEDFPIVVEVLFVNGAVRGLIFTDKALLALRLEGTI